MPASPLSALLGVVHNNNQARNAVLMPGITQLCEALSGYHSVSTTETSHQPEIIPLSPNEVMARRNLANEVAREWALYREAPPPHDGDKPISDSERRSCAIEAMVTDKHLRIWQQFLGSTADVLICFEDDAVFRDDSIQRLMRVLGRINAEYQGKLLYVDLAGGFPLQFLGLERVFSHREDEYVFFKKPVTNTACAYLMTRELVGAFTQGLRGAPHLLSLPIDWLINKLLIENERAGLSTDCFHLYPTIFEHGSATGRWNTWQPPRA